MGLTPGARLGAYEVIARIGVGGMGEVYRARDTKLDRDVAIKVLPEAFAADPERIARFQREAKTLAALNHPHIAAIYGIEESGGTRALVMELVEGEDLSQRIARGPTPLDEALPIAKQIAEALAAAHEQGIIHRDLKPANIKVTADGVVKVLDFGLAKLNDSNVPTGPNVPNALSMSPTITSPAMMTGVGVLLGTAAYMSPEQAKGREADKRSDVWAFGCVVYEMLTGQRAFSGEDVADTLANVLKVEPDWSRLPIATPAAIHRLLHRCLAKDRKARLPDIGVARLEIEETNHGGAIEDVERARPRRGRRAWLAWTAVALCLVAGAVVFAARFFASGPASLGVVRFQVDAPEGGYIGGGAGYDQLAVSPDGRRIAFRSGSSGTALSLYVRALDSTLVQQLRDTDRGSNPFWSPDSRHLGFVADGKLKTIDLVGGTVQALCDATAFRGGTWNGDDVILFAADGVLYQVPAGGGEPAAVTRLDAARGDQFHRFPQFLPDDRHFLFTAVNRDLENTSLQIGELGTSDTVIVDRLDSKVQYAWPGYLLFASRGALMARPFDPSQHRWTGEAVPVADTVRQLGGGAASFSISAGGVLAYDAGSTFAEAQLTWVSRGGQATGTLGPRGRFHTFWLARDEKRVVVERAAPSGSNASGLWLLDGERSTATVFTPGAVGAHPAWSPDGRWVAFSARQPDPNIQNLVIKEATGLKDAEPLLTTPRNRYAVDWSLDGKAVVFQEQNPETGWDLGLAPLAGSRAPTQLLHTRFAEQLGQLSPNGRFMAYVSNETGRDEVYVVNVPDVTKRWPVSNAGGGKPRWQRDGSELFFVDAAGMLMSASIGGTQEIEAGVPKPLFDLQAIPSDGWNYAVSADGQRFLVLRSPDNAPATPITVVLNWAETLKK